MLNVKHFGCRNKNKNTQISIYTTVLTISHSASLSSAQSLLFRQPQVTAVCPPQLPTLSPQTAFPWFKGRIPFHILYSYLCLERMFHLFCHTANFLNTKFEPFKILSCLTMYSYLVDVQQMFD